MDDKWDAPILGLGKHLDVYVYPDGENTIVVEQGVGNDAVFLSRAQAEQVRDRLIELLAAPQE